MNNLSVFSFLFLFYNVLGQGYYSVIGPRIIRPNSQYHCAISVQETTENTVIKAVLQGRSFSGIPISEQCRNVLPPYSSMTCNFEVADLEDGIYNLQVAGSGGLDFATDFPLEFLRKSYSVFIQTDRAVYQPGSKISFRAIILDSALKPAAEVRSERLQVYISDGQGNRITEWNDVDATTGVFAEALQLSNHPVLGNWNISVIVHGQTYHKTVEVAEYVLPKFIVEIKTPEHITFKENILTVNINTRYDYGKALIGEATVSVFPTIYSGVIQPIFQNPVRKVIPINGSISVDFNIENDLRLNDEYERTVIVDVTVEEASTGRRQNNSAEVHIHKYDCKIEIIKTADYFKPGLRYIAYVKVSNNDGTPVKAGEEITIRHGYSRVDEVYEENKHKLNKNGLVKLEYYTPKNVTNTTALRIEAEYKDLKERMSPVPAAVSVSNTFLQISLDTQVPLVNGDVEVTVNCTEPVVTNINYVIMGRGDVLLANTLPVNGKREFGFRFTAFHAMFPLSHLTVYYIQSNGEFISDTIDIEINDLFENSINIDLTTDESEPNRDVEFTVRTQQNALVGLLAVDENVKQLRGNYDITHKQLAEELNQYDAAAKNSPYSLLSKNSKSQFMWKPGASNSYSAIYESGAELLTNALVVRHKPTLEDIYLRPVFYGPSTVKPDRGFGLPLHSVTRPPLAGPYAFSRIPRPVWNRPKVYLLNDIAPTWLFTNFSSGYKGTASIRRKIPESLTTWSITAFSLDPVHGLSLINSPKKLKVSKSFVITMDLPYSVRKGEILAVPVVVYNHNNQDVIAEVTLHNTEQKFEFAEVSNEIDAKEKIELYRRKKIFVKKHSGSSVSFMIMPQRKGLTEIRVTANSPRNQDVTVKNLLVEAEGVPEYYSKAILIDLRQSQTYKGSINFTLPKNIVEDSEKIEVSAISDFLGPAVINLENLIRLPSGCGEQNMVHFMPNLIILQYLKNTRQLTPAIENRAISLLETSYQQQLSYKRSDGSFSPFGHRDLNGSVWLTSYVALAFKQAKSFIYIDETIINHALEWLSNKQGIDGSFVELGNVIHQDLQNTNGNSLALTAFALLAFLENSRSYPIYANKANRALDYIASNIDESESVYTIALCSYVLQLAKHRSKQSALNLLEAKAKTKGNMKWWAKDVPKNEEKNPWNHLPKSIDIETTSYALLTYAEANLLRDAIPVLSWLINQENSLGGFTSSQDTVIGLQALYKMVIKFSTPSDMIIEYTNGKSRHSFKINGNNAMSLQSFPLGKDTREVNISADGSGIGIFRTSYQYNMNVTGPWPMFTLDPQVDKNSNDRHLQLSICVAFVSGNLSNIPISNMAVMEITLPSGYTADTDSLPSLEVSQNIQKVETSHQDTKVILYFNNLTATEYCPTVSAFRTHKVANQRPVPVVVYDYYDSSRRARVFYNGKSTTLCDICEGEDCGDICSEKSNPRIGDAENDKDGCLNTHLNVWLLIVLMSAIMCRS